MSDITHARKAAELADVAVDAASERLTKASVEASLAVASAVRELDTTVRQRFIALQKDIARPETRWLHWDEDGQRASMLADDVIEVAEATAGTAIRTRDGATRFIPLPYGQALLQLGGI